MINFLLMALAAVLVWSMSARGERLRAALLVVVVLILSSSVGWVAGVGDALASVFSSVGGKLG
jgi:uncharacterized membrane protein YqjE